MINFKSAMSASMILSLTLGTFSMSAHALPAQSPISLKEAQSMSMVLREIMRLEQKESNKIFNIKDHKGESIFVKGGRHAEMEKNLWATLDPATDAAEGTSTEKVYQNFKIPRKRNEIIVAVIDSGVDISHEDLKGHIWTNEAELYGKPGVDDDGDGYVDDVYGWNFLGNKKGENVGSTNLEVTRIFARLKSKSDANEVMSSEEKALFAEVSAEVTTKMSEAAIGLKRYQAFDAAIKLLKANGLKVETVAGLAAVTSTDTDILNAKKLAAKVFGAGKTSEDIKAGVDYFTAELAFHYNPTYNSSDVVGDDPANLTETGYGNPDVTGSDAHHGTHVSGIIAANRLNNFGINGQTLNVKIMSLRAVPDGDERDKDVANAVRFAVDHGARVINMSFGKAYSPNKTLVDEAMKYAEAHGVLLVHAAGNDGKSTESRANNYPNRRVNGDTNATREIETWLEVGASSKVKGAHLPADFSNYGKTAVDVFAPGKDIVSTIPGNKYASFNGTSMASPETAGVAALLLGRHPFATALEVKHAIMVSTNQYPGLTCALPGTADEEKPTMVNFSDLSASGGTVNAFQAMLEMQKL